MKNIKKKIANASLVVIISFLYILFIPVKSGIHTTYSIDSAIDTTGDTVSGGSSNGYFIDDTTIGYFDTQKGKISYKYTATEGKLISGNDYGFVLYDKFGFVVEVYSNDGSKRLDIKSPCYPYIPENYPVIYLIKTNGMGFSSYLMSGDILVKDFSTNALITSVSIDKNFNTAVSLSDGRSLLLDREGDILIDVENDLSAISVSKSAVVDNSAGKFFTITGVNPEFFSVYDIKTGGLLDRIETKNNLRYAPIVTNRLGKIFYETGCGINIYDYMKNNHKSIDFNGELKEMDISSDGDILVLTENNERSNLIVFSITGVMLYSKRFSSIVSNVKFIGKDRFYFKVDDVVVIMKRGVGA